MRITAASGLVLVAALAAPAFGQSFLGEWTATAHTPGGDVSEVLHVGETDEGFAVTADLVEAAPEGAPLAGAGWDIALEGDSFSYKRTVTTLTGVLVITYAGVVDGDAFTGTVKMGEFAEMPYTGVRVETGD